MKRLMILNGPNLNLLGVREPHIYGTTTLAQIKENCERHAAELGLELAFHQSNHEGEIVDWIQSARQTADAIIINPAGFPSPRSPSSTRSRRSRGLCSKFTFPTSMPATSITGIRRYPQSRLA
jgi:hypothetical protein